MRRKADNNYSLCEEEERKTKRARISVENDPLFIENQFLPDDLVLEFFRRLDRRDVIIFSTVCRQWHRVGSKEELQWVFVKDLLAWESPKAYYNQRTKDIVKTIPYDDAKAAEELILWRSDPKHSGFPVKVESGDDKTEWLYNAQGELVAIANIKDPEKKRRDRYPLFNFNSYDKSLWKYEIVPTANLNNTSLDLRLWKIRLSIHLKNLDNKVIEDDNIIAQGFEGLDLLLEAVNREWVKLSKFDVKRDFANYVNRPLSPLVPRIQQPNGFKDDFKLYNYQLDAITWMQSIEDGNIVAEIPRIINWQGSKTYFDTILWALVHPKNFQKMRETITTSSGILADESGLGKTYEVLGLILASPIITNNVKSELHEDRLISTRATMIVCPNNAVVQHWQNEISRVVADLKVLSIGSYEHLKTITYEEFRSNYDIILFNAELFLHKSYIKMQKKRIFFHISDLVRKSQNYSKIKCPIVEHFYFHRVVYDDLVFTEEFNSKDDTMNKVYGQHRWIVTPLPTSGSYKDFFDMLNFRLKDGGRTGGTWLQVDAMMQSFVWRNTRDSVKDELEAPEK